MKPDNLINISQHLTKDYDASQALADVTETLDVLRRKQVHMPAGKEANKLHGEITALVREQQHLQFLVNIENTAKAHKEHGHLPGLTPRPSNDPLHE
jgi:hypothetical protein